LPNIDTFGFLGVISTGLKTSFLELQRSPCDDVGDYSFGGVAV